MSCSLTKRFLKTAFLSMSVLIGAIPGISAFASTNSGIDTPTGVTTLPFAVEGVEGMVLYNSNPPNGPVNVGIGVTSPAGTLHVHAGTNENFRVYPTLDMANGVMVDSFNDAVNALEDLEIRGAAIDLTGGNVGIGVTNPIGNLDIENGQNTATLCLNGQCTSFATPPSVACM